jgi:signal recognition particle receptor subunit beta
MVFLNYTTMQVTAKIVYYGPGLCGKTTNLRWIHSKTAPQSRGEMVSLETESDRTLFFDLLPLDVGIIGGLKVRLQLYTVPGQVFYNATRRLVLKGVDGVVFVADSQAPALEPNEESLANLRQNLEELGLNPPDVPLVLQYNKRDLRNILPVEKLEESLNPGGAASFEAAAIHGVGVFETLKGISRLALRTVRDRLVEDGPTSASRTSSPSRKKKKKKPGEEKAPAHEPVTAAPPAPPPEPLDPALMEPLQVEFAEEDTDKVKVRAVQTKGSFDIGTELRKLRSKSTAEAPTAVPDLAGDGDTPPEGAAVDRNARQEIQRKATLDVSSHLLRGLTDLRFHLGFDRDGREEILRDAVRLTLVGTRRLEKLSVRLDLDLSSKE